MINFPDNKMDTAAILFKKQTISYRDLKNSAQYYQQTIDSLTEEFIFIPMFETPETIYKIVACIFSKKVFIPINPLDISDQVSKLSKNFPSSFLWETKDEGQFYKTSHPPLNLSKNTLFIGFTSGSTGEPKGFIRDKKSWQNSFDIFHSVFPTKKYVTCLTPLHYSLGLYVLMQTLSSNQTFLMGIKKLDHPLLTTSVRNNLQIFSVPTVFTHCLTAINKQVDGSFEVILGGEQTNQQHLNLFSKKCPEATLSDFYGTSETSFISYHQGLTRLENSVGTLFPNVKVTIDNPTNGIGEINVFSPMIFQGYLQQGKIEPPQHFFKTGDLGKFKDKLYYYGRKDSRINRKGVKLFPQLLENILRSHHKIKDCFIYGEQDTDFGERVEVQIIFKDTQISLLELNRYLKKFNPSYKIDRLYTVTKLNMHQSGKRKK